MKLANKVETVPQVPEHLILWDINTVKQVLGLKSSSAIYRNIKEKGFPEPLRLGGRISKWRKVEVLDWLEHLERVNLVQPAEAHQ